IAAIRWYELHQDTVTKLWNIYQQSTYAPADGVSRWNPCIAMDQNGSIGLAYSVSDPVNVYPGLRYTGRRTCDLLNTMTVAETIAKNGNALAATPQGNGNRWGDYSEMSVDPSDGITFWATNMYTNSSFGNGTNVGSWIFSFQITQCPTDVPDAVNNDAATFKAYQSGNMLNIKGTDFPENERLVAQIFDINGRMLMQKDVITNSKTLETSFNVSTLAKAIYLVRVGNDHIQRVVRVAVN
ncbi:MAG TPA: T9SS type A sorting domain-containing protein, partial [Bacteroidia bacterium]|nr:T9SS type A sorting domain-containing protein [Bacteroidia bacterium]